MDSSESGRHCSHVCAHSKVLGAVGVDRAHKECNNMKNTAKWEGEVLCFSKNLRRRKQETYHFESQTEATVAAVTPKNTKATTLADFN